MRSRRRQGRVRARGYYNCVGLLHAGAKHVKSTLEARPWPLFSCDYLGPNLVSQGILRMK